MAGFTHRLAKSLAALGTAIIFLAVTGLIALVVALGFFWLPTAAKSEPKALSARTGSNIIYNEANQPVVVRALATPGSATLDPDEGDPDDMPVIEREGAGEMPIPPDLGRVNPAPGIVYYRTKRTVPGGDAIFNVLEIADVTDPRIGLKVSLPNGKAQGNERVTDHLARNGQNVVAAINGDFYDIGRTYGGVTINMQMQDGEIVRTNEGSRPAFGIGRDGFPIIGTPQTGGSVIIGKQAMPIYHINYGPGEDRDLRRDWLTLWTPTFGSTTRTWADPAAFAIVVRNLRTALPLRPNLTYTGTVAQVIEGAGDIPIPADGVVIHGRGSSADFLRRNAGKGTILSFNITLDEPWAGAKQIIGGCNRLLVDWVIIKAQDTDCARQERDPRMPRTAIAFEGKKVWLVTVDGRQPNYSVGTNNDEFAQFLLDLGARHALNLDGGGSTTFVIRKDGRPLIVNRPSDGRERAVANALLVVANGGGVQTR